MAIESRSLALAGIFICISAAFHVFSVLVAGFYPSAVILIVFGVSYFALGSGFLAGSDHWAKATVPVMLFGMAGAYAMALMHLAVPNWWLMMIIWADGAVALFLGIYLLRR